MKDTAENPFKKPKQKRVSCNHFQNDDERIQQRGALGDAVGEKLQLNEFPSHVKQRGVRLHHKENIQQLGG